MPEIWRQILDDRHRFFWVLQCVGWLGFAAVNYIASLTHQMRDAYIFVILLNAYAGWMISIPLRLLYQKIWNTPPWVLLSVVLVASYVSGGVWTIVKNLNLWEIYKFGYRPDEWIDYFQFIMGSFYIMLCWSGLYFGIKYYQMLQSERQKSLISRTKAHEAQLTMLRYQLNPHFLFNTLNAISTLILINENKIANGMVTKLREFLRYTLDKDPIKKVTLDQEIYAIKLYLDIEKVRFEDRLQTRFELSDQARGALVPSMILQPLIENAIKYAVAYNEHGGNICVKGHTFGQDLLIEVSDNGPGTRLVDGHPADRIGVGIRNTQERLQALYDNNYSFVMSDNEPTGLVINIRMPIEKGARQ
ncbi:MAG: two-component system LytT family sensor kinase [Alteromonadaceae bacterium]